VRSERTNDMIPLSTLLTIKNIAGTELTTRFNLLRSVEIQGAPARGYTSGQALAALEQVFEEAMPREMGFAYSSISYQEKIAPPPRRSHLHHGHRMRFPAAGCDVRELASALGSAVRVASRGVGCLLRRLDDGVRQQRLRAGRTGHADRTRGQERHSDCGIRQGEARRRVLSGGVRSRVSPLAFPPDPDDSLRLHPGRRAVDACQLSRGGGSASDGDPRVLADA